MPKYLQETMRALGEDAPFVIFNLGLSEEEKKILAQIKVLNTQEYDNFGELNTLNKKISAYLQAIGNDEFLSKKVSSIIDRVIKNVIKSFESDTAWVTVRSFLKNDLFDIPRWHTDGYYYSPYSGKQYKVAITLKGANTLFCKLPAHLRKVFTKLQSTQTERQENRKKIAEFIGEQPPVSVIIGQGVIFVVGDPNKAAVHSEPPMHMERLFLSILPGSKAQISELYAKWHPGNKKGYVGKE